jgi:hypothetical protein
MHAQNKQNLSLNRNIAAPFQPNGPQSPRGTLESFQLDEKHINITYVATSFPELESPDNLDFETVLLLLFCYFICCFYSLPICNLI